MDKLDFNMVTGCGDEDRIVLRYKDTCYIGCFEGSKKETIEAINNKYSGGTKRAYIAKVEELYAKDITESDVDASAAYSRAIKWASNNGHLEVVKYLVSQGADVNNAIKRAGSNGHLEVVKYLVGQGAGTAAEVNYAAIWASEEGHLEVVSGWSRG